MRVGALPASGIGAMIGTCSIQASILPVVYVARGPRAGACIAAPGGPSAKEATSHA